ncbi:MAG: hypothetical protein NW205_12270 [Hyphomicrobiaceae bacterium]|nr:hypothetical protein [Hyphomicrobiaceae bacterium]
MRTPKPTSSSWGLTRGRTASAGVLVGLALVGLSGLSSAAAQSPPAEQAPAAKAQRGVVATDLEPLPGADAEPAAPAAPGPVAEPAIPAPMLVVGEPPAAASPAPAATPLEPVPIGEDAVVPEIRWRVENPFRFFTDPADTARHRDVFLGLSPAERRQPILAAERALAKSAPLGWAADVIDATCWDPWKNRHVCGTGSDYIDPSSHRILVRLAGLADAEVVTCQWTLHPAPHDATGNKAKSENPARPLTLSGPCNAEVGFDLPYPAGGDIEVALGGRSIARVTARVSDILIVGLGDSFGSGEGNPDVPVRFDPDRTADYGKAGEPQLAGYPARVGGWKRIGDAAFLSESARWLDQACHRSLYSHQVRAALQLAVEDDHRAVTFVGLACSGAEIVSGLFLRYKGNEWTPNPPDLSQISAAAVETCAEGRATPQDLPEAYHMGGKVEALRGLVLYKCSAERSRRIDLLMVSVGGNDIGFARLLANAILVDQSLLKQLGGWVGQVHGTLQARAALALLDARYKSLNRALHNILHVPWNESDRILLTAYPEMALLGDGRSVCPDGAAGMEVVNDFALSARRARDGVNIAGRLHAIMQKSASAHGWTFVDRHRAQFLGRGICAGFTDNAFSADEDLRLPRRQGDRWVPYNPAHYRPYASRQRWFRTPNDAFLTGNFHVPESLLQKVLKFDTLSWFQLLLASTYSGAFHPTAEGHAAIADAVAEKARSVLARYDDRIRRPTAARPR